jgi:hypothetical protein
MSTLLGAAVLPDRSDEHVAQYLATLHVAVPTGYANGPIFAAVGGSDPRDADALAARVSADLKGAVFSIAAQTSADVYVVGEFRRGNLRGRSRSTATTKVGFHPQATLGRGKRNSILRLPVDELAYRLSDDDRWSEADIEMARRAYAARSLDQLPRLPDPNGSQVVAFLRGIGVDLRDERTASYEKPGFF